MQVTQDEIIYSIKEDGSAWIWGIWPNEDGIISVPEIICKDGVDYPVVFINFGRNGKVREDNGAKLLQKSGIRKNEVIELIYRSFI